MTKKPTGKLSRSEENTYRLLQWLPWVSWLVLTIAPGLFFLFYYFTAAEDAGVYLLIAMTSMGLGSAVGIIVALALLFYRRYWAGRLRERLAADGITAGELPWFDSELTSTERRVLKRMQTQDPLLADAYGETLALRLNASRFIAHANGQLLVVRQQISRASNIRGADTTSLLNDLRIDQSRLEEVQAKGRRNLAQAETRLQTIEAAANRGAGWAEANLLLQRLDEGNSNLPLALETAQIEQQAREDTEREMRAAKQDSKSL
jgi:hypothetical protein